MCNTTIGYIQLDHIIQVAAGLCQLCAGQIAGVEAAFHAVRSVFNSDDTETVLLVVDTSELKLDHGSS